MVGTSTDAALDYLGGVRQRFDGDWYLALAAYNTGEGNVQRAIERNRRLGRPTDYWSLPLSAQACNYVPRLIALSRVLESPEQHGVALSALPNSASWVPVEVGARVDLNRVASRAGIDAQELRGVNPAYGSGITPAQSGNSVLVPAEDRDRFVAALRTLACEQAGATAGRTLSRSQGRHAACDRPYCITGRASMRCEQSTSRTATSSGKASGCFCRMMRFPRVASLPTSETLALKEQGIYGARR